MLKALAGLNLFLIAGLLAVVLTARVVDITDAAYWWRQSKVNEFELSRCETKRRALLKQIRNEGLWSRLGLERQPWLQ